MSPDELVADLARVADTGEHPGDEDLVHQQLREYFEPDASGVPDDVSRAEVIASPEHFGLLVAEAE